MSLSEIQGKLLAVLYRVRFVEFGGGMKWDDWASEHGYAIRDTDQAFYELREDGLVDAHSMGRNAKITTAGALFVEEQGLVEREIIARHEHFRTQFLLALAEVREERGLRTAADWETITRQIGAPDEYFGANYQILVDGGYMESTTTRSFRLTAHGYEAVGEFRQREGLGLQFDQLSASSLPTPGERASALAVLLEEKCAVDGWNVEHVELEPGAGEVSVFYRDLNFFLVDCAWPDGQLEGAVVRELRQRVAARPGTFGCLFSMSAVSDTAISEAQTHLETACIIIFGPTDLTELFHGGSLTEAVTAKMVSARIRRSVTAE